MFSIWVRTNQALASGAGLLYGLFYFGFAVCHSLLQRETWLGQREDDAVHLRDGNTLTGVLQASNELWSLSSTSGGVQHNFLTIRNVQLHYLTPRRQSSPSAVVLDTLIVFVHGFPDSAYLFAAQLCSPLAGRARLVALDLPGCGGSDSIASYGPNQVLNLVLEAVQVLKAQVETRKCILVGHDWGGVIGYRIAAETERVIDHLVTLNSLYPAHAEFVLKAHIRQSCDLLSRWRIRDAYVELRPVLSQLRKSGYTYMLTLPIPLARLFPSVASSLLRFVHDLEYKQSLSNERRVTVARLAMAYGPSSLESLSLHADGLKYGSSVLARSKTSPPGHWDDRIRIYAEGLLLDQWVPSYPQSRQNHARPVKGVPAEFKCPVNIIFGLQDIALDPRIVLDGIERLFSPDDEMEADRIARLPNCGHWSILEQSGIEALDNILIELVL